MADGGGADFTLRLVNEVMRPARQIKSAMKDVEKAFLDTKRAMAAPMPKRGGLDAFDKNLAASRRSQAKDFARQNAKAVQSNAKLTASNIKMAASAKEAQQIQASKSLAKQAASSKAMQQFQADNSLGRSLSSIGSGALVSATVAIGAAALVAAAGVAYLGAQFLKASVHSAAFAEHSRLALSLLIGDMPTAIAQFDSLRHEAASLGMDVERTQHSFQKLLAAQFEIGKARELIRMGADLQAIGASADGVEGVLLAMTQIKSKGRLQAQEMLQLQERGISAELVYAALGKTLHKTRDQLAKMQEAGEIKAPEAIEAILEAVRKKTGVVNSGDAGKKFAESTLLGMSGVLAGGVSNFFIDVGDAMLPGLTKVFGLVRGTVAKFGNDPAMKQFGDVMLGKFNALVDWTVKNWPTIEKYATKAVYAIASAIVFVAEVFDASTVKGQAFYGALVGLAAVLGLLFIVTLPITAGLWLLTAAAVAVLAGFGMLVSYLWEAIPRWYAAGAALVGGIIDGMKSMIPGFTEVLNVLGGNTFLPAGATAAGADSGITTAANSGAMSKVGSVFSSFAPGETTVAGESDKATASNVFNFDIKGDNIDKAAIASQIRSAVTKALEEVA